MNNTIALLNGTLNQTINQTAAQAPTLLGLTIPFTTSPLIDIYLISLVASIFVTLINKKFTDQARIKALRQEMKDLRKKSREAMTKDPKKAQQIQAEMMKKTGENMKHAMNPKIMLITMAPMLFLFAFIRKSYSADIFPVILNLGFTEFTWFGTYITFSIINSIIVKKLLDVA